MTDFAVFVLECGKSLFTEVGWDCFPTMQLKLHFKKDMVKRVKEITLTRYNKAPVVSAGDDRLSR